MGIQTGYIKFNEYVLLHENDEILAQPHTINADPPMKFPQGIMRISEAFKKAKEVPIGKEIDPKAGGEKDVTLKAKKLFIVGDAVTSYLMGKTPHHYELVTDAHPDEVEKILTHARPAIRVLKKDPKKGVIRCNVDGETYDIGTLKKHNDEDPDNGVFTTNPADDSLMRDMTISALYYDVMANKITDHVGGLRHLKDGVVKSIGKPDEMLGKNGMSKFKAAKLANVMPNGKLDPEMKAAINQHHGEHDPEEIRQEFIDGLEHRDTDVVRYIKTYQELGLLDVVFPKLELNLDFPEGTKLGKCRALVLAWLLKKNKPQKLVARLKELKYTDREIKDAVFLINLLVFSPEYAYDFYKEKVQVSLSRRQVMDWVRLNHLNEDMIEKLMDWQFSPASVSGDGQDAEGHGKAIRHQAAQEFRKHLRA